jgi:hypothetical protein
VQRVNDANEQPQTVWQTIQGDNMISDQSVVHQTVKDAWWEPKIDRSVLKGLMKRADGPGLYFLAIWLMLLLITGFCIHLKHCGWNFQDFVDGRWHHTRGITQWRL